jgi:hypothetical protein
LKNNVPIKRDCSTVDQRHRLKLRESCRELLSARTGSLKLAEDTAQAFLGIRIQCAQCHNHPFDRWTMEDYRGFVAFFTQVGRKNGEDPRERIVFNRGEGESKPPVGDRVILPKFLAATGPDCKGRDRREVLASWIASPQNPYFPRHIAKPHLGALHGRGIVEPADGRARFQPAIESRTTQCVVGQDH